MSSRRGWTTWPGAPPCWSARGRCSTAHPGCTRPSWPRSRDEPLNLLIALGFDQDPSRLGPLPPHIRVQPTLPQAALLPRCALLVCHGGFNSVKEALAQGVPLVILPIAGDQPYCARRCQALGVARVIGPAQRHPQAIRAAVRAVLGDPAYRDRARHMRDDIHALPPARAAAEALERLVQDHAGQIQPQAET